VTSMVDIRSEPYVGAHSHDTKINPLSNRQKGPKSHTPTPQPPMPQEPGTLTPAQAMTLFSLLAQMRIEAAKLSRPPPPPPVLQHQAAGSPSSSSSSSSSPSRPSSTTTPLDKEGLAKLAERFRLDVDVVRRLAAVVAAPIVYRKSGFEADSVRYTSTSPIPDLGKMPSRFIGRLHPITTAEQLVTELTFAGVAADFIGSEQYESVGNRTLSDFTANSLRELYEKHRRPDPGEEDPKNKPPPKPPSSGGTGRPPA